MFKVIVRRIFPKKIHLYFSNIFYYFYISLLNNYNHIVSPGFNTVAKNNFFKTHLIDLLDYFTIDSNNYHESVLISYKSRINNFFKNKNTYIFESWVFFNGSTYSEDNFYIKSYKKKIFKSMKNQKIKVFKKNIFLLPYYTNQAGHFMGENLGSILYFLTLLKMRKKKEKLLIICPHKNWLFFFKKEFKDNIIYFSENYFLKNNIKFTNSMIFPKFSLFQNYMISKNILSKYVENYKYTNNKYFLTSERDSRIFNNKELTNFLKKNNFKILNPVKLNLIELFQRLNSAKLVISESASIVHNIHLSRNKPYYVFLSKNDLILNKEWYRLTQYYCNFHTGLYKPFICEEKNETNKSPYPYNNKLIVNIKKLKLELNNFLLDKYNN